MSTSASGLLLIPEDLTGLREVLLALLTGSNKVGLRDDVAALPDRDEDGEHTGTVAVALEHALERVGLVNVEAKTRFAGQSPESLRSIYVSNDDELDDDLDVLWELANAGVTGEIECHNDDDLRWVMLLHARRFLQVAAAPTLIYPGSPRADDYVAGLTRQDASAILALVSGDAHPGQAALVEKLTAALG